MATNTSAYTLEIVPGLAGNIDATIVAQKPRLALYIDQMRKNIADALELDIGRVNIKASTTEQLGFEGRQEGISAHAVCLLTEEG